MQWKSGFNTIPPLRPQMASALGRHLVACLLNISEARRRGLVEKVARAAITDNHGGRRKGTTVLNIFSDYDYNRSVITIVASIELIKEAVLSACEQACSLIDMNEHEGIHPCMGAVDLIPLYPLGEEVNLKDCGREAQGIGASPYVMNCNVTIDTQDLVLGRGVAAAIRESSPGGIQGVQVMALPHEGTIEIACNVESVPEGPPSDLAAGMEPWPAFNTGGQNFYHAPASLITAHVTELAGRHGVATKGTALVGFTPLECKGLAEMALSQDIGEFWKMLHSVRM
ncbi:formiminotransferase N-terminal subdomain-containing protein isoform X3 [Colossoma macropomum]|uniref:formiminotransferase N-terminal subdomain-containing protein isoform X3 n=1 Tax=Colossoma macropomum TaxID=42526 RepID=UPI0018640686|nr:formiminotransferase N-terminal subdomain-containing protein isoform X3 [Colossoma macropomum]